MSVQEPQCIPLMALPQDEKPLPSLPSRNRKGAMGSLKRLFLKSPSRNRRSMTATWFTLLFFVLLINVVLTVILYVKSVEPEGVGRLYRILSTNNCKAMEQRISFYHLGINILSTVVLAASGYFTQLLSSPTREELDKLHARRQWQHIGIRSVIQHTYRHLAAPFCNSYNSIVFPITQAVNYYWLLTNSGLVGHAALNLSIPPKDTSDPNWSFEVHLADTFNRILINAQNMRVLNTEECIASYTPTGFGPYGNPVLVTTDPISTGQLYAWGKVDLSTAGEDWSCCEEHYDSEPPWFNTYTPLDYTGGAIGDWLCSASTYPPNGTNTCDYHTLDSSSWTIHGRKIDYCLSQQVPEECCIGFIPGIMLVVLICNALKVAITWYMVMSRRATIDKNLSSVGDAVAAFLQYPDCHTEEEDTQDFDARPRWEMAPAREKQQVLRMSARTLETPDVLEVDVVPSDHVRRIGNRWREAAPKRLWFLCIAITLTCIIVLLVYAFRWTSAYYGGSTYSASAAIKTIGFGRANLQARAKGDYTVLQMVFLANVPQVPLMALSYLYTDVFTRTLMSRSWIGFSRKPKGLRVARPRGAQRGTYLLGMPLRYGTHLIIIFILIHWIVSQSVFPVAVAVASFNNTRLLPGLQRGQNGGGAGVSGPGFSLLAAILTATLLLILMISTIGLGFRKFNAKGPVFGCSSLEIRRAANPGNPWTHEPARPWTAAMVEGKMSYQLLGILADGTPRYGLVPGIDNG